MSIFIFPDGTRREVVTENQSVYYWPLEKEREMFAYDNHDGITAEWKVKTIAFMRMEARIGKAREFYYVPVDMPDYFALHWLIHGPNEWRSKDGRR